ncbi:MAG: hypothetical protein KA987_09515 [Saprospiraceae bacterium]|nr:hypothetical protein [Saprospiraceae bacterium]
MNIKPMIVLLCFIMLSSKLFSQTDPFPYRAMYVDKFIKYTNSTTVDEARTLLGRATEEDSLLQFAHDNDFKTLILYDIGVVLDHASLTLPGSGGRTYEQALCDFIQKAKQEYCIAQVGAAISSLSELDDITDFNTLRITDPYSFTSPPSGFTPPAPNPLSYAANIYTAADGEIALRAEMIKEVLRINDFNSICSNKIELIVTEYEFWQQFAPAGCLISDSVLYPNQNTIIYRGVTYTAPATVYFQNNITITLPTDTIFMGNEVFLPGAGVKFNICRTNEQFWTYRQFLHDVRTVEAGASHPFLIDTYLGWFSNDSINDILQTDIIDSVVDRIGIHTYRTSPSTLWGYFDNRDSLFGHNSVPNTIVHPIISAEQTIYGGQDFLGVWLANQTVGNTLFEAERIFMNGYLANTSWHGDNVPLHYGAFNWFAQSFFKNKVVSGNRIYLPNKLYQRPATTCSGNSVFFNYIGPNETGQTIVWNYNDGSANDSIVNPDTTQQNRSHTFLNSGTYIVSTTVYYPVPNDTSVSGCTPYTYVDTVFISGVKITPSSSLSFCDGGSVLLSATAGASSYQWKRNGSNVATTQNYTATTSGTYSVTATGLSGCASSTATVSVTVYSKPDATISSTNVSCNGGSNGTATVSVSNGTPSFSYLWNPGGSTSSSRTGLSIGSHTVFVTDSKGCKDTAIVTITQPIAITITPTLTHPCISGSTGVISLSVAGGTTSYSYSWNTGATTSTISSLSAGTYIVTVTDANSCIKRDTIVLFPDSNCCGNFSQTLTQTDFDSNSIITGSYNLNTNIIINHNVTLKNCTLSIGAGVRITDTMFVLTIDSTSLLYACNRMWRGILVYGEGEVHVLHNSSIRDAQYGIEGRNGAVVESDFGDFTNNFVGIYLNNSGSGDPAIITTTIINSNFTSSALHSGYSGQSPSVYTSGHGFAGIKLENVTYVDIGMGGTQPNNFTNLNCGITSYYTSLNLNNYFFSNIQNYDSYIFPVTIAKGAAIGAKGNGTHALTAVGYNSGSSDIKDCIRGIMGDRMSMRVNGNYMFNCDIGVYCGNGTLCTAYIRNNHLDCNIYGIQLLLNDNINPLIVENNTIDVGSRSAISIGSSPHAIGIDVAETNKFNSHRYIRENTISLHELADHGILTNGVSGYTIDHNYVTLYNLSTNLTGITIAKSDACQVNCNAVAGTTSTFGNSYQSAFWIEEAPSNTISCNTANDTRAGYTFAGGCIGGTGTIYRANDIGTHDIGLHYRGTATRVDKQSLRGNYWYESSYPVYAALNDNNDSIATLDKYEVDLFGPRFPSDPMTNYPDTAQINPLSFFSATNERDEICGKKIRQGDCIVEEGGGGGDEDKRIAQNLEGSQDFDTETRWKLRSRLYEKLLNEPNYLDSDTVYSNFFYDLEGSSIEQVASLNKGVSDVYPNQSGLLQIINARNDNIQSNSNEIAKYDSLISVHEGETYYIDSIKLLKEGVISNTQYLVTLNNTSIALLKGAVSDEADILSVNNSQINASEIYELNEKDVNEVYLNYALKEDETTLITNYSLLFNIATQCPLSGGPAVYKARTLIRFLNSELRYNDELTCALAGNNYRKINIQENNKKSFSVFPNPANQSVQVYYSVTVPSLLKVYNEIGILVFSQRLDPLINQSEINTMFLKNGIYHCRIDMDGDSSSDVVKLIILH